MRNVSECQQCGQVREIHSHGRCSRCLMRDQRARSTKPSRASIIGCKRLSTT